ncbi:helix-turn-helix domain-containing protein [Candidatus Microgenomates bacterium]|nr:helix-turn-helix domain-containing protein [Candidatus Microgenomates bacterium]
MSKPKIDKNIQIPTEILPKLLTPSEMRMIKNRFQIVNLLEDRLSIRSIAKELKVGTDTVVRVIRLTEIKGFKKKTPRFKIKSSTPWIFGKSND